MTFKDKLILILLSIITFGIYPLVIFNKKSDEKSGELKADNKVSVDLTKLLENLGTKENLVGAEYTHTKVKIFIKDRQKINIEALTKQKGISGVFASSKFVTIIVGPQAKTLAEKLM